MSETLQTGVGIFFGERTSDATLQSRYGLLIEEIVRTGLDPVVLRGAKTYNNDTGTFSEYSIVDPDQGVARLRQRVGVAAITQPHHSPKYAARLARMSAQQIFKFHQAYMGAA